MNNKSKILFAILFCIGIISTVLGLLLINSNSSGNSNNDTPEVDNEEVAKDILEKLSMDDFIASYFDWSTEIDQNLIALSFGKGLSTYFYANKNVEKYILVYENPNNCDVIYIKYSDFIKTAKKIFNDVPAYNYEDTAMVFPNMVKNADGKYDTSLEGASGCDFSGDTTDCLVLVGAGDISNSSAEFSQLKINDNVIVGNVKKYYAANDKDFYVDGTFEFIFEKVSDNYIAKSFKITKINAQ